MAGIFENMAQSASNGQFAGTGATEAAEKSKSKSAKQLAELQNKFQQQQNAQQNQFALQQQAQAQQSSLALQQGQQGWQSQWNAAELTGTYNGQQTLASKAQQNQNAQFYSGQAQQNSQFGQSLAEQQAARNQQNTQFGQSQQQQNTQFNQSQAQQNAQYQQGQAQQNTQFGQTLEEQQAARGQQNTQFTASQAQQNNQFNQSQAQQGQQFGQQLAETTAGRVQQGQISREEMALQERLTTRNQQLAELTQQQNNAVASGNLDLAREIQTKQVQLQAESQALEREVGLAQVSGRMSNGQETEAARQFNTSNAMNYAQMQAKLAQSPEDYFEAAALQRSGAGQDAMGFLRDMQNPGASGNAGFRTTMSNLPQTNSMANIAGQTGGPSTSMAVAQNADATGAQGAFTSAQNRPAIDGGNAMANAAPTSSVNALETGSAMGVKAPGEAMPVAGVGGGADMAPAAGAALGVKASGEALAAGGDVPPAPLIAPSGAPVPPGGLPAVPAPPDAPPGFQGAQNALSGGVKAPGEAIPGAGAQGAVRPGANQGPGQPDAAQQRLAAFAPVFKAGAQKLAPGAFAAMSSTERGLFNSAAKASGINPQDFEQSFNRSRLQTGAPAGMI